MKAVIMGGGQGTRLRPLTCNTPKPLVPLGNRPVIDYVLQGLNRLELETVYITLFFLPEEVRATVGEGDSYGFRIRYCVEDEPLGTAGALGLLSERLTETFVVVSGDAFTDIDLGKALDFHRSKGGLATMVLARVPRPLEFGVVLTDSQDKVYRLLEKPSWGEVFSDTVNTGIYIFEPSVLDYIESSRPVDFAKDLFPQLLGLEKDIYGYVADGYWCDIGTVEQYHKAQIDLLKGRVSWLPAGEARAEQLWVGANCDIDSTAIIERPAVIGENCTIAAGVKITGGSVIGPNAIIESGAIIDRSILWSNCYIGKEAEVVGSILGKQVTVRDRSIIQEGCLVADEVHLGAATQLQPNIQIWPDKYIAPGAILSTNLVWGHHWPTHIFSDSQVVGLGNIEIHPEFALQLGSAYGTELNKGSRVLLVSDGCTMSNTLTLALATGLTAVGVHTTVAFGVSVSLARNSLVQQGFTAGAYCFQSRSKEELVGLVLFDRKGLFLSRALERKIEYRLFRKDFRRTTLSDVGLIDFVSPEPEAYLGRTQSYIVDFLGAPVKCLRVALEDSLSDEAFLLKSLFVSLGHKIVSNKEEQFGAWDIKVDLSKYSIEFSGFEGRSFQGLDLAVLMVLITREREEAALVAATANFPGWLEELMSPSGRVVRTKIDMRSLSHTAFLGREEFRLALALDGSIIIPQLGAAPDRVGVLGVIVHYAAHHPGFIHQALAQWPSFALGSRVVPMLEYHIGQTMRAFIEQVQGQEIELVDGVKINDEIGWSLVVPAQDSTALCLWVETPDAQDLEARLDWLENELRSLTIDTRLQASREYEELPTLSLASGTRFLATEEAFFFASEAGFLGVKARSLAEFVNTLQFISIDSIWYHFQRGDFSAWLEHQLGEKKLARQLQSLDSRAEGQREDLRERLIGILTRGSES